MFSLFRDLHKPSPYRNHLGRVYSIHLLRLLCGKWPMDEIRQSWVQRRCLVEKRFLCMSSQNLQWQSQRDSSDTKYGAWTSDHYVSNSIPVTSGSPSWGCVCQSQWATFLHATSALVWAQSQLQLHVDLHASIGHSRAQNLYCNVESPPGSGR